MTTIEGTYCKLNTLCKVDMINRTTHLTVDFRRDKEDKWGDFYNTYVIISDPIDQEHYGFTLDEIYDALKQTGKLYHKKLIQDSIERTKPNDIIS